MSIFQLIDAGFAYNENEPVLEGLNLSVEPGESVSILGANGCGKSTLLKIFAGLLYPGRGEFRAFGERISSKAFDNDTFSQQYHRRVGFIFQDSDAQLFCSTVYEELAFGPLQLGLKGEELRRRVQDTAQLLGIEHLLQKTPFRLSGGEKKKVAIACVLILNPEVLILDEPTNGLDPRSRSWLLRLLQSLTVAGKTLLFATHNLELVPEVSQRAVLFDENHAVAADMPVARLLQDAGLLRAVNLVDENYQPPGR